MKLGDIINPSKLPEPWNCWTWVQGRFSIKEIDIDPSKLPVTDGKIVIIFGDSENFMIDVAWGEFGEIGSMRAMYVIPKGVA